MATRFDDAVLETLFDGRKELLSLKKDYATLLALAVELREALKIANGDRPCPLYAEALARAAEILDKEQP